MPTLCQFTGADDTAESKGDAPLALLIRLAAYSGARIEELCSLRTVDVGEHDGVRCLYIRDAKTAAGNRLVPVHWEVAGLVQALIDGSTDGYLLPGLVSNKYADRSPAISKRFGRLKNAFLLPRMVPMVAHLPEGEAREAELRLQLERYCFHGIRHTVATLLQNADVPEVVAANLLGHRVPSMSYGTYSAGASPKRLLEAVRQIAYPVETEATPGEVAAVPLAEAA